MPSHHSPVALVTGSSRGIGRGIATTLAASGWSVAIHFVGNRSAAEEAKAECESAATGSDQNFSIVQGDVSSRDDRTRILEETIASLGLPDALVNNAGIGTQVRGDILEATEASFETVLSTNLQGPYFLTQEIAKAWLENGAPPSKNPEGRKIIFVGSVSATLASINRGDYCLSKAGVAMAAQLFAHRLAPEGIQVVELRPGIVATDMTSGVKEKYDALIADGLVPQGRWVYPEDVGRTVRAIVSGDLPSTIGTPITIDGGLTIPRL